MNDYLTIAIMTIGLGGFVFLFCRRYYNLGLLATSIIFFFGGFFAPVYLDSPIQTAYEKLPYSLVEEYTLSESSLEDSLMITGTEESITFFDENNIAHTKEYGELVRKYESDVTPTIQIYKREEGGLKWCFRDNPSKIVIVLPVDTK